jgi:hypothetical protein
LIDALSLGNRLRSHTTYAVPGWCGSAVTDSLSLKWSGVVSEIIVAGALQVWPPSVDVLACTAEVTSSALADRLTQYARPSGPTLIHGSDARS